MFEVTKSVFYREKRNFEKGKVEDEDNGVVKAIHTPGVADEDMEKLVSIITDHHKITSSDIIFGKASVKIIESSIIIKRYLNNESEIVSDSEIGDWEAGKIDIYLGCYKHEIQKVERARVDLGSMFYGVE